MRSRRWLLVFPSLVLLARTAPAQPPALPAAPAPSFDPAAATPYFADGPAAEARRRFFVDDWAAAARLFDAYVKEHGKAPDLLPARFLGAYALSKAGSFAEAADRFERLIKDYPLLADHHRLYAARARLAAKQYGRAIDLARKVPQDSPLGAEALLVAADAARAQGSTLPIARGFYRDYLERFPDSWRAAEVRFRLGSTAEAMLADPAGREGPKRKPAAADVEGMQKAAREQYRAVYIDFPASSWAAEAKARLAALDKEALVLSAAEHLRRGLALFDQMRNEDSEAELAAALSGKDLDATQRCVAAWHRAQSVFKQRNRPRAAPLFDAAIATCERAGKGKDDAQVGDLHAKGLYQGARCHAANKELAVAIAQLARIEAEHPGHSYADDARVRIAELIDDALRSATARPPAAAAVAAAAVEDPGKLGELVQRQRERPGDDLGAPLAASRDRLLATVADRYPKGDMGGEALFRLALHAFEDGRLDAAKALLDKELGLYPREEGWWEAGRTLYWLARIAALQHDAAQASALYTRAALEYPLSYYALQALSRLREQSEAEALRVVQSLAGPELTTEELAFRFPPDPVYGSPGFQRGVELARLGLGTEARRELSAVGIKTLGRGGKLEDPAREPQLWLAAVLYDRAGEWALSHAVPRYVLTDYARRAPQGENRKRWLLSFPQGYKALVVEHAARNGQPAALQFAIIREESAFDPTDESFANAVGLTQLTQAPAKRFAQGLPYTREALRDPVINVTIGARELGDLWKRTSAQPALTIAGYNAGDGAVRRWMRAVPADQPLDLFIEHIPYDETRGYTKRVLGSYFAYQFLYQPKDPVPWLASSRKPF